MNLRVVGRIPIRIPSWIVPEGGTGQPSGQRIVTANGQGVPCDVWARGDILAGTVIEGPAVIEEMSATTYLPLGWRLTRGRIGQLELSRLGA